MKTDLKVRNMNGKPSKKIKKINKIAIKLINFYQSATFSRPSPCRFSPSCSQYSRDAFEEFGFFKAFYLTFYRVLRCNPIGGFGYDPIPEVKCRH